MAEAPSPPAAHDVDWGRRLLLIATTILVLLVLGFVGAAFLPRWWAHRVGAQVGESMTAGIALGLFYGFVFTGLPVTVLRIAFRRRRSWRVWGASFLVAVVLALPNLLTLGIVVGSGHAAHAGERTLDVEAPGFRGASLAGALVLVAAYLFVEYLLLARRRSRRREAGLRERLRRHEEPGPGDDPALR